MRTETFAPQKRGSRPFRSIALFVVLAAVTSTALTVWQRDEGEAIGPASGSEVSDRASLDAPGRQSSSLPGVASPVPALTRTRQGSVDSSLLGDALARAWLRAFLTRDDRYDDRWVAPVASLSERDVVDDLRAAGPDAVGLQQLTRWRVERVDRVADNDSALDTPTRQVLAYAATVTDGVRTEQKPFVLYAYLDLDGSWRVGDVEQPYSSEG